MCMTQPRSWGVSVLCFVEAIGAPTGCMSSFLNLDGVDGRLICGAKAFPGLSLSGGGLAAGVEA